MMGENGEVKGGMGGKFNGKNIKDAHGTVKFTSHETNAETEARHKEEKASAATSDRLKVLETSLKKKKDDFDNKLQNHFDSVRSANGQPLNDKKGGASTLRKWEQQNDSLRNLSQGISKTEAAIEREKGKIASVNRANADMPAHILNKINSGELAQWRKNPDFFFVPGVEKARIHFDRKTGNVGHRYVSEIKDKEQYAKFRDAFNALNAEHKAYIENKSQGG